MVVCSVVLVTVVGAVVLCVFTLMQLARKNAPASAEMQMMVIFISPH